MKLALISSLELSDQSASPVISQEQTSVQIIHDVCHLMILSVLKRQKKNSLLQASCPGKLSGSVKNIDSQL